MNNKNDLEKTKVLEELSELNNENELETLEENEQLNINSIPEQTYEKDIIDQFNIQEEEIDNNTPFGNKTEDKQTEEEKKEQPVKKKKSIFIKFRELSKKKKIIIFTLLFIFIILLVVFLFLFFKQKKAEPTPDEPSIIIEKDNYRYENGKLVILDKNKKELGVYECENKQEDLCYVAFNSTEDKFDNAFYVDEEDKLMDIPSKIFMNRYLFISDNKKDNTQLIKLYDLEEKKTIEEYQLFKTFETYVAVKNKEGKYGLLKIEDKVNNILDFKYDYIGIANEAEEELTRVVTKKNNMYFLTDLTGKELTSGFSSEIKGFNNEYLKVTNNSNKYQILNYQGNAINNDSYDYITLLNDYFVYVNNLKAYAKNYQNVRMNITGIPLYNEQFKTKIIYHEETKETTTLKSYEATIDGTNLKLDVTNNTDVATTNINLLEGKLNSSIKYLEYFDGILYFYRDQEKNNLLGSYKCENRNDINANTKEYNNCKIGVDTIYEQNELEKDQTDNIGLIPIYNSRYTVIEDRPTNKTEENRNIILYDLTNGKILGKYRSINTYSYTKLNELSFMDSAEVLALAQNQKGQYGMIKIEKNKVTGVLGFVFNSLEKAGNNYIASEIKDEQIRYRMYNATGQVISADYNAKIVDYNELHLKILKENKYHLYNYEGEEVIKFGFDYISLFDEFCATVTNNVLNIYKYSAPEQAVIDGGINLERNNYTQGEIRPYKITIINRVTIKIEIGQNDDTYKEPETIYFD